MLNRFKLLRLFLILPLVSCGVGSHLWEDSPEFSSSDFGKRPIPRRVSANRERPLSGAALERELDRGNVVFVGGQGIWRPQLPPVEVKRDPLVRAEIQRYLTGNRVQLEELLIRREEYSELVELIFYRHGLPLELINIAVLESGLRPEARSPVGAVGMWQLMPETARSYGLRVDGVVDERMDVLRSTEAVAAHLVELWEQFQDWSMVLAAYNSGAGAVSRIAKREGSADYNSLASKGAIYKESVDFVRRFLALTEICRNTGSFGLSGDFHTASRAIFRG